MTPRALVSSPWFRRLAWGLGALLALWALAWAAVPALAKSQAQGRLGELLGLADIHLLPQCPQAEDLVLPSKLTGMLSSGRPIVATCHEGTEMAHVVSKCGVVVPPDDQAALVMDLIDPSYRN